MTNLVALLDTWQQWSAHHTLTRALGDQEAPAPVVTALDALRDAHELVELLTAWQWQAVHAARRDGAGWEQIATATGTTVGQARAGYIEVLDLQEHVLRRGVSTYREVL